MKVKDLILELSANADLVASQSDGSICCVYSPYVIEEDLIEKNGRHSIVLAKKGDVCINVNF